jgi:Tripartite tricarboxylate transporter TctB family
VRINKVDVSAGAVFALFGTYFVTGSATQLPIGTASEMGPGFFPLLLGFLLIALGGLIGIRAIGQPLVHFGIINWRSLILVSLAPILFGLTIRGLGLGPATAISVLTASLASRRMSVTFAIILTVCLTLFCILTFSIGLGLPLPIFGHWIV